MGMFDDLVQPAPAGGMFDDLLPPPVKQNTSMVEDFGTSLKIAGEKIPGMLTGIGDMAFHTVGAPVAALTGINRPFDRAADYLGEKTGLQPAKWAKENEREYSDENRMLRRPIGEKWDAKDYLGATKEYLSHPSLLANDVISSAPNIAAAAGIAVGSGGLGLGTAAAPFIGEGLVAGGSIMDQIDRKVGPGKAALASAAAAVGTAGLGAISGKVAQKLKLDDIDVVLAGGHTAPTSARGVVQSAEKLPWHKRIPASMVQEGLIEEMPQSMQEQAWQNYAEDKPIGEGVARAGVEGAIAGAAMGGGMNAYSSAKDASTVRGIRRDLAREGYVNPDAAPKDILRGMEDKDYDNWLDTGTNTRPEAEKINQTIDNPLEAANAVMGTGISRDLLNEGTDLDRDAVKARKARVKESKAAYNEGSGVFASDPDTGLERELSNGEWLDVQQLNADRVKATNNLNEDPAFERSNALPAPQSVGDAVAVIDLARKEQESGRPVLEGSELHSVLMQAQALLDTNGLKYNPKTTEKSADVTKAPQAKQAKAQGSQPVAEITPTDEALRQATEPTINAEQALQQQSLARLSAPSASTVSVPTGLKLTAKQQPVYDHIQKAIAENRTGDVVDAQGVMQYQKIAEALGMERGSAKSFIDQTAKRIAKAAGTTVEQMKAGLKARAEATRVTAPAAQDMLGLSPARQESQLNEADLFGNAETGAVQGMGEVSSIGGSQSGIEENVAPPNYQDSVEPNANAKAAAEANRVAAVTEANQRLAEPEARLAALDWNDAKSDEAPAFESLPLLTRAEFVTQYQEQLEHDDSWQSIEAMQRDFERSLEQDDVQEPTGELQDQSTEIVTTGERGDSQRLAEPGESPAAPSQAATEPANQTESRVADLKRKLGEKQNKAVDKLVARYQSGDIDLQRLNDELTNYEDQLAQGVQYSEGENKGSDATKVSAALKKLFFSPEKFDKMVTIVQTARDLKPQAYGYLSQASDPNKVQGFVGADGRVYMIAGNIRPGSELAVFLHEVGVHLGMAKLIGQHNVLRLSRQIAQWSVKNDGSQESELAKAAHARAKNSSSAHKTEEVLAYFIEEAVNAGIDPTAIEKMRDGELKSWFRTLWAAAKTALRKLGLQRFDQLTAQNLVDLAYGAAKMEMTGAWHGTAADFRNFDHKYMNSGEGAQAFGWGTYLAQAPGIAHGYWRDDVGRKGADKTFDSYERNAIVKRVAQREDFLGFEDLREMLTALRQDGLDEMLKNYDVSPALEREMKHYLAWRNEGAPEGSLMRVDTAVADDEFLDWDKPLSEQSETVKKALKKIGLFGSEYGTELDDFAFGFNAYHELERVKGSDKAASDYLDSIGIKGIRFLDSNSRDTAHAKLLQMTLSKLQEQHASETDPVKKADLQVEINELEDELSLASKQTRNLVIFNDKNVQRVMTEVGADTDRIKFSEKLSAALTKLMKNFKELYGGQSKRAEQQIKDTLEFLKSNGYDHTYSPTSSALIQRIKAESKSVQKILDGNPESWLTDADAKFGPFQDINTVGVYDQESGVFSTYVVPGEFQHFLDAYLDEDGNPTQSLLDEGWSKAELLNELAVTKVEYFTSEDGQEDFSDIADLRVWGPWNDSKAADLAKNNDALRDTGEVWDDGTPIYALDHVKLTQLMSLLADTHARVRELTHAEIVPFKWERITGGSVQHLGSDVFGRRGATAFSEAPAQVREVVKKIAGRSGSMLVHEASRKVSKIADSLSFLYDLVEQYQDKLPSIKDWHGAVQASVATKNRIRADAEKIAVAASELKNSTGAVNDFLAKSTTEQKWGYDPKFGTKQVTVDPEMEKAFKALTPEEQDVVKSVFKHGEEMNTLKFSILKAIGLDDKVLTGTGSLQGPYAPLKRFGDHIALLKSKELRDAEDNEDAKAVAKLKADPAHYQMHTFDTNSQARNFAEDNADKWHFTDAFEKSQRVSRDALPAATLQKVLSAVGVTDKMPAVAKEAMTKLIQDMYFQSVDEHHARTSGLKRKNYAGFESDMMRSFLSHARSEAGFLANMQHGGEINSAFYRMQQEAKVDTGHRVNQDVFNTIAGHYAENLNFQETPWQDRFMAGTAAFQLATSVGYHLTNMMQPAMVTVPRLAADFNDYSGAWKQIIAGYKVLAQTGIKDLDISAVKDAGLRSALQRVADAGLLNVGMMEDLTQFEATRTGVLVVDKASQVAKSALHRLRRASQFFENMNRVSSATAAYRMAMENGKTQQEAEEYAISITRSTQGDSSRINKPMILKKLPKMMTQYKGYQFMMAAAYSKAFKQAFMDADPEVNAIGKRMLAYKLFHASMAAGVLGLPMMNAVGMVFAAVAGGAGDDKEPKDLERTLREMIGDEQLANLLLHGPMAYLGLDMSAKLGEDKIFSIMPYGTVDLSSASGLIKTAAGLAGPAVSQAGRFADGVGFMQRGDYYKGVEKLVPKGVENGMKAFRLANEGYTLKNGDVMFRPEDISGLSLALDALGLPSSELKRMDWIRGQQYEAKRFFVDQTKQIEHDYAKAYKAEDSDAMSELRDDWFALQSGKDHMRQYFGDSATELRRQPISNMLTYPHTVAKRERKLQRSADY